MHLLDNESAQERLRWAAQTNGQTHGQLNGNAVWLEFCVDTGVLAKAS